MAKYVTFGEIMLRLKPPGAERFFQSPLLEATFGGGRRTSPRRCAGSAATRAFVSVIPPNAIGDACVGELRRHGIDTSRVVRKGARLGIYFLEAGANQRPSVVIYDRAGAAIAEARHGRHRLGQRHSGAPWFHITGITPAISQSAADLSLEAVRAAKAEGPHGVLRSELPQEPLEVREERARGDGGADEVRRCGDRQ